MVGGMGRMVKMTYLFCGYPTYRGELVGYGVIHAVTIRRDLLVSRLLTFLSPSESAPRFRPSIPPSAPGSMLAAHTQ